MVFRLPVRVYYEDTDAGGIVYHANYLKYCERARTEFLSHLGIEQDGYLKQNIAFVVKSMAIDFKFAAKFNERLQVETTLTKIKRASVEFVQQIVNQNQQLVFTATVQVACIDTASMKPNAIPTTIIEVLKSARGN